MTDLLKALAVVTVMAVPAGGCALGVAAGAGYTVGDEVNEGDGEFDVLEDVRGEGNGAN